jgi:transglutaminase-like putative cysteine protease
LKVQIKGPSTTYTYNLTPVKWETFPLSDGNGTYQTSLFENVTGNKYALVQSVSHSVTLKDEFAPFLRPNQYVDYSAASASVAKANELTEDITNPMEIVAAVYDYVVKNLTYDKEKAATVQSGYLPILDSVLESKKGICFDYAALMTGMLRSQGIPCKLVVGYAGTAYHAWINVWSEESGWINGAIYFDGKTWQRMDPTFASSANQSKSIMTFIGNGKNYTAKYLY